MRSLRGAATIGGGLAVSATLALGFVTFHFAKTVVTVPRARPDDLQVLAFDGATITLSATPDSILDGRYSFWFAGSAGHATLPPRCAASSADERLSPQRGSAVPLQTRYRGKRDVSVPEVRRKCDHAAVCPA